MTMDPFNALVSSGAGALAAGANIMAQQGQANRQLAEQRSGREQQMLQFMMSQDTALRQERGQERQLSFLAQQKDREFMASREDSAFARLNASLDRQLKHTELESKQMQQAFDNSSLFPSSPGRWLPPGVPGESACR